MQEFSRQVRYYRQSILFGALIGIGVGVIFAAGFFFRGFVDLRSASASTSSDDSAGYPLLDEVQTLLDEHYLRQQPSVKEREYAAIRGVVSSLNDRFTFFVDPPVTQSESDVLAGTYGGIGVLIQRSEKGDLVLHPFKASPAAAAGIEDGDILTAVNKSPVDLQIQPDVLDQMLRGEVKEGSGVEITASKAATGESYTVFVPFAVINVPSVVWRTLPDNPTIGYVQILLFTSRTPDELKTALGDLEQKQVQSLVLDLRNNSGGLLHEAVEVASQFVDGGVVVYEKSNTDEQPLNADSGGLATKLPLVVLVNQGTASAAELVAGAIQDRGRGILVGQTTYGKGTVQQIFRLSDDSSLHITAAEWLTPKHRELDGKGLDPDISMIPDANGRDVELGEAVRQLEKQLQDQKAA
jgi:carboxyl-terminal processing protease